jgi:hypothetical protein
MRRSIHMDPFESDQFLGQNEHRDGVFRNGRADRAVGEVPYLSGSAGFLNQFRDIRKRAVQIQFLLVTRASNRGFRLTCYGKHGNVIKFGIIETGEQIRCSGAAGGKTDSEFAGW